LKLPHGHQDASPSWDSQITGLKNQFRSVFPTTIKIKRRRAWCHDFTEEFRQVLLIYRLSFWSARPSSVTSERVRRRPIWHDKRARLRGVKMGRPPKFTDHRKREPIRRRDDGDETLAEIGRGYNVSHSTISRLKA
jgi:Sigma-70, region 4